MVRGVAADLGFAPSYTKGIPNALDLTPEDAISLARLGAVEPATTDGGVAFAGPLTLAYHANLESRLASRILWRVGGGPYRDEHTLYALAKAISALFLVLWVLGLTLYVAWGTLSPFVRALTEQDAACLAERLNADSLSTTCNSRLQESSAERMKEY